MKGFLVSVVIVAGVMFLYIVLAWIFSPRLDVLRARHESRLLELKSKGSRIESSLESMAFMLIRIKVGLLFASGMAVVIGVLLLSWL